MNSHKSSKSTIIMYCMTFGLIPLLLLCSTAEKSRAEKGTQLPEGKVVSTIEIPEVYPQGVVLVKDQLWVINSKEKNLLKIDVKTKRIVDVVRTPIISPRGLAWDGKYFWCTDNKTKMVHQIDPTDGKIVRSLKVPINGNREEAVLEAVAWDGKYLWVAYAAGYSSKIYKMNIETGDVMQSMFANCHPKGLATDGEYLWVICYNKGLRPGVISQRRIMDDSNKMNASRRFLSKTPGKEPCGITYDGKYFWVVDKNMKVLQKIEIPSEK